MPANYDELLDASLHLYPRLSKSESAEVENLLAVLVALPRTLTVFEIFKSFEDSSDESFVSFVSNFNYSRSGVAAVSPFAGVLIPHLYPLWVDSAALLARSDEVLGGKNPDLPEWENNMLAKVARMVLSGKIVMTGSYEASYLGGFQSWEAVSPIQKSTAAVFNCVNFTFESFSDTFANEGLTNCYVLVEVVDAYMKPAILLWEGTLNDAITAAVCDGSK